MEVSPVLRTRSTLPVCPALRWVPTFLLTFNWDIIMQRYTYIDWQDTIVSGWGTLSFLGSLPDVLQWVKVPPLSDATCNQPSSYNGQITANMICAGLNNCFHFIFVYICTVYNYFCLHLYSWWLFLCTFVQFIILFVYICTVYNNPTFSGLRSGGKDSCQGDSGGPLVTRATG